MPAIPVLLKSTKWRYLATASSSTYTQSFDTVFEDCERVDYIVLAHASVGAVLDVTIATDSSGTSPTDLGASITVDTAGKLYVITISPAILTSTKQYVSPKVTRSAGTYSLVEVRYNLRDKNQFTQDTSVASITKYLT